MRASRRTCYRAFFGLLVLALAAPRASAETLTITSSPSGATLELDGAVIGTTPYHCKYPGGYFHKTHSVFGTRLEHAMVLRISKAGYAPQQITLTDGPIEWIAITGRHRGNYWLFKTDHFDVQLQPLVEPGDDSLGTEERAGPLQAHPRPIPANADSGTTGTGSVLITSDPTGAEIYVDGKFVGQAPSTITLATGSHRIDVKAPGKQNWERDIEVLKDSQVTLHPVLEAQP